MSDVYIPGIRSRFSSDQLIEDLMTIERIPRDRVQTNIENLQTQRSYWNEVGRRITSLRDSARNLFSFQNPFNERTASSSDTSAITASATREASEQSFSFTVKQIAAADRFLSQPLNENTRIDAGNYVFTVNNDEIAINFRGGTLREFVDIINNRGRGKIGASLIAVQSGTRSLLLESKLTGTENRLGFSADTIELAKRIGMMEQAVDSYKNIAINESSVRTSGQNASNINISDGELQVAPLSTAVIPVNIFIGQDSPLVLRLETKTRVESGEIINVPEPPTGPVVPSGSVSYGGIIIENEPSSTPLPDLTPPSVPQRNDDMGVLLLSFSDGTSSKLPLITDSGQFVSRQFNLAEIARGRTIVSLNVENSNTHREVLIGKIEILDPASLGGLKPVNAVSTARDAIITMEGIEITRSTNAIDDLIPGVTLNVKGVSDKPVNMKIEGNTEAIKDAIISFVGNYNRLLAEINVLTSSRASSMPDLPQNQQTARGDTRLIDELTYLNANEIDAMRERLGAFSGDITLNTLKNNLMRTISVPYPTSLERDLSLLAQIGISTNASGNTGYDVSRLRGYLEINEKTLDAALENRIPAIKELFAYDSTGDLLADTGVAYNVDALVSPFVQTGGIISLKTSTIDSRISQDQSRITNLDRQLASKEQELRLQFARMESAYAQMESLSNSLNNFSQQNQNSNR
ncbi:MAG: flagellar filament capping protein FliD [Treponema sp.]|jgi:flagellar hook-associated protein 2|nr:flagellar filament capping protein FliD [Treponema sp.]